MTKQKPLYLFHLLALCIVCVWGTTFVSTKTLISNGLTPTEIFIYRFALAYICVLFMAPRRLFADTFADEMRMIAAGLTGGSVYFITENTALGMMQATNVAILISVTPLLATCGNGGVPFGTHKASGTRDSRLCCRYGRRCRYFVERR